MCRRAAPPSRPHPPRPHHPAPKFTAARGTIQKQVLVECSELCLLHWGGVRWAPVACTEGKCQLAASLLPLLCYCCASRFVCHAYR
jgi:hypothetical protein